MTFGNRPGGGEWMNGPDRQKRQKRSRARRRRARGEPAKGGRAGCIGRVPVLALFLILAAWGVAKVVA